MKWDQNNPEKVKDFIAKMKQDYAFKKAYAARRAWDSTTTLTWRECAM